MVVAFAFVACSGPPPGGGGPGDGGDAPARSTDTGETDLPTETGLPGEPGVRGRVVGPDGEPLADFDVLACTSVTCFTQDSDGDGAFHFDLDPPVDVAVKTHERLFESPRLGAALEPIQVVDGLVDVGALYVPDLPVGVVLAGPEEDPQSLAVGDGLELTLNRADLVPDFGVFLHDVAARRIPDEHVPVYGELGDEEVVAVYAIHPFATASTSPVAVRMPCALPAGAAVNLRHVDPIDGRLSAPATGVCDGAFLMTDPGQGLTKLTHLVVSRP